MTIPRWPGARTSAEGTPEHRRLTTVTQVRTPGPPLNGDSSDRPPEMQRRLFGWLGARGLPSSPWPGR